METLAVTTLPPDGGDDCGVATAAVAIGTVLTLVAGGLTSERGGATGAAAVCTLDGEFVTVDASGTLGDWMAVADAFL